MINAVTVTTRYIDTGCIEEWDGNESAKHAKERETKQVKVLIT
jgi:hypothetical protein